MPSVIQGYEYDVFISYRQKDNKGSHWVSEFVSALSTELESTFKEDISIYFDENPHDGLLENHDVDKTLDSKLKCLIFLPIISRTYCDPKSFAWQHEFCAFNNLVRTDKFGKDVKLSNGNIASRILPIRIHDIDAEDHSTLERELGGPLRAIDFIYRSTGVNRPLNLHEEHAHDNVNKTYYRDQINKVSNAIREIIQGLKKNDDVPSASAVKSAGSNRVANTNNRNWQWNKRKRIVGPIAAALLVLAVAGYFVSTMGDDRSPVSEEMERSVAVLPFEDISDTGDQGYFSDGMMIEIMDHLFKVDSLRVIPRTSTVQYANSSKPIKEIARELGVSTLLTGSVRKFGDRLKISVQLIRGHDEVHLWQQVYERNISDVFEVQSDVSQQIANALQARISPEVKLRIEAIPTKSHKAYDYFLQGRDEYWKGWWKEIGDKHANLAIELYDKAIALDSNFSNAYAGKGQAYWYLAHYSPHYTPDFWTKSTENLNKALALDPQNGWAYSELAVVQHNWDWDRKAALRSLKKAVELNPGDLNVHIHSFWYHLKTGNCDSMMVELNKMRAIQNGEYIGNRIMMAICNQDLEQLKSLNTDETVVGSDAWAAIERMLILKEFDRALSLIEKKRSLLGEQFYLYFKGETFALWGKKVEALEVAEKVKALSRTEHVWISQLAAIYMGLGDEEMAYKYLEQGVKERDLAVHTVSYSAAFYSHRNDPRFVSLLARTWVN